MAYIEGKDYSIGGYSYLETTINDRFINDAKNDENIPDEIKDKYFNINLDDDNIYFRPNENMSEDDFRNDISQQISNVEYKKIRNNKKFTFLPFCEKFEDEKTLYESPNLKCLTEEQKNYIINHTRKGDWIYKIPEIKVKLLTKNIGVYEEPEGKNEKKVTLYIFCNGKEKDFDIDKLTDDLYSNEKIIPINENCFNIFDRNEMQDLQYFENGEDFQWKLKMKFNNELQMKSFLKLLILSRNNINKKWKDININKDDYTLEELFDFEHKKYGGGEVDNAEDSLKKIRNGEVECVINIANIDFDGSFSMKEDKAYIKFQLIKQPRRKDNDLLKCLENCKFKNSLLDKEKNKKYFESQSFWFDKKVKILKEKIKEGHRKIDLNDHMKMNFKYDFSIENDYTLIMLYIVQKEIKKKYYSILNITTDNNLEIICEKYELPFYEKDKSDKIYGCLGVDIYEKEFEDVFLQKFEEINSESINNPYNLILKETPRKEKDTTFKEKYKFGLYEPNIFRRKILRKINEEIGIDPTTEEQNIPNFDKNKLENLLEKKCVKEINDKLKDIQINFDEENNGENSNEIINIDKEKKNNSYKKKAGIKLLKLERHQKFLKEYTESEWQIFYKKNNYGIGDDFSNLTKENLLKNKKETDELYNLIFLGIPNKEKREIFYKIFLDIDDLYKKTKEKAGNILKNEQNDLLDYFCKDIENKTNIIFSLIDDDCSYLCAIPNSDFNKINSVKKIAKSFYVWAELKVGLKDDKDRYVYFLGILYITYKLYNYFGNENLTFLLLIGLSQKICHFRQQNPLFYEKINYINLFGLVTKLILEQHQKKIYEKFLSLNFPLEFFISKHLSSLYTDYFEDELMMRIFDILIFESGIEGKFVDDMQYLRILCAIPITLLELNKKDILECESVSELESILSNLISHSLNMNKFKVHLQNNLENIYHLSGYFEEYIKRDEKRKWDDKRGELYLLINKFFKPVYLDNINYLEKIKNILERKGVSGFDVYKMYFSEIEKNNKINFVKELNKSDFKLMIQISKLQQIYNNENTNIEEFIFEISFDKDKDTFPTREILINFDTENNKIINIQELFYEADFKDLIPTHIFFVLKKKENDENIITIANFSYNLTNCEFMKMTNIILENKEKNNKYILEFILYKDTKKDLLGNDYDLYKKIFGNPKYINSNEIEEKLSLCKISGFFFNKKLSNLINSNNDKMNEFLININYDKNKIEMYKYLNNNINENNFKLSEVEIDDFIKDKDMNDIIKKWISNSDISLEEIFYCIALVDKSYCINEKILFLYSIAQEKDRFIYGKDKDRLSTNKLKEMIYSLYKRFMVYFTKNDVDRMVDFLLKDERLFNIKYAFIYNKDIKENESKINDFIYDKDRYNPKLHNKKFYEIYFDNISRQLNTYLNYLNNNYNIKDIPKDVLIFILTTIINNSENISKYIKNKLNKITLVIEKDNLLYKREFEIVYSLSSVSSIKEINKDIINQNLNDDEIIKRTLCDKIYNINTNEGYSTDKFITYEKFKKIFLKLPYLSDLLRVNFAYNITEENLENKEFKQFKVVINYEKEIDQIDTLLNKESIISPHNKTRNYFNFYFPKNEDINSNENNIDMDKKIKINETVCNIIQELIEKIKQKDDPLNKEIEKNLKLIDKIGCYIYYYEDENNEENLKYEKIGYFDSLYSCPALKEKNKVELRIIFSAESFNITQSIYMKLKAKGYYKIYYSNNKDFIWKKIKINSNAFEKRGKVKCFNNYNPVLNKENDYVLAYNL